MLLLFHLHTKNLNNIKINSQITVPFEIIINLSTHVFETIFASLPHTNIYKLHLSLTEHLRLRPFLRNTHRNTFLFIFHTTMIPKYTKCGYSYFDIDETYYCTFQTRL